MTGQPQRDHSMPPGRPPLYAVAAEFVTPEAILAAARALRDRGFGRLDIHSPIPLEGAMEALGQRPAPIPQMMALGAFGLGFAAMMGLCLYASAYDYVFPIGGRPLISWPAFIVPSVSFAALLAAATVFFNMTFLNRLPLLNHPAFNIPNFGRVTQDRFFLTIEPAPRMVATFDPVAIERAIGQLALRAVAVRRVPR